MRRRGQVLLRVEQREVLRLCSLIQKSAQKLLPGPYIPLGLHNQRVSFGLQFAELGGHERAQITYVSEQAWVLMMTTLRNHLIDRAARHQAQEIVGSHCRHPAG